MTDTAFYDRMAALADRLLTKFGSPATLRRFGVGPVGADGKATKVHQDYPSLAVETKEQVVLERLNAEVEAAFVFKGPEAPTAPTDHLFHGGREWKVTARADVNPEGSRLLISFIGCVKP